MPEEPQSKPDASRVLAALCYGFLPPIAVAISIVVFLLQRDDVFLVHHAKQGIVFGVIGSIAAMIPLVGPSLAFIVFPLVAIYAVYHMYRDEFWKMPFIGAIVKKINK